jgi:3-dehydroquinate dehydratase-2
LGERHDLGSQRTQLEPAWRPGARDLRARHARRHQEACTEQAKKHGLEVDFRQSNSKATLIDWLHEARGTKIGVAINPAGLSFHSIALLDALKMFDGPKVEVPITNIRKREPMYQKSIMSHGVTGVIAGLGATGYVLAIDALAEFAKVGKA